MASRKRSARSARERLGTLAHSIGDLASRAASATSGRTGIGIGIGIGLIAAAAVIATSVLMLRTGEEPGPVSTVAELADTAPASEAPAARPAIADTAIASVDLDASNPADNAISAPSEPTRLWQRVEVRSGDTLEIIFRRLGLSPRLLHEVVHLDDLTRELVDLRPGDEIAFDLQNDSLDALRAEFDDEHWLFVERRGEALSSRLEPRNIEARLTEVEAEIRSSLFNDGKDAGLSDNMILRLAGIFGWDIDFALDIRRGDRFALVFEEIYRDGKFLRQGNILAARFINQGDTFEAVRFDAGNGPDYFAPDGRPMRKQFLRAPLNFTRVTSNFNPRRFHPVTRRVRAHNGTDYGAPTGTPIWAAGDGTVIEAGYGRANGNYVFIKHGNHIVTRYLHLNRKMVKRGDRVRQGQTIGTVGATGLATGPHLHYEFLVHGRHRDPRQVELPEAEPLPADLLPAFETHARPWLARLDALLREDVLLVQNDEAREAATEAASPQSMSTGPN